MKWTNFKTQMGRMKHYFIACFIVFIAGIVLGYGYSEHYQSFIDTGIKALEKMAKDAMSKQNPQASLLWIIFINNITNSLQIIVLGVFLGVLPLFFLLTNGLLLGYMVSEQVMSHSLWFVVKGIVPHGIIEIPSIIFASALGLRLGILLLKTAGRVANPARRSVSAGELKPFLLSLVPACGLLVAALFIAAVLESTLTYWLLRS